MNIRLEEGSESATLILTLSNPAKPQKTVEERDLLLRFTEPIEIGSQENPDLENSFLVESIVQGFDTLLIRAARPVQFFVETEGKSVIIRLQSLDTKADDPIGQEADLRLALLKAQLLTETGRVKEAGCMLYHLHGEHPANPDVLGSLASLEESLERSRRASEYYRQALRFQPENEDFREALDRLESPRRPRIGFSVEGKTVTKAQQERILGTESESRLSRNTSAGVQYATNYMEIDSVRYEDGTISSFRGSRRRSELFLSYLPDSGGYLRSSILTNGTSVGASLRFQHPDYLGFWEFLLDYKRPNWDFVEGIANQTLRDRIQVRRLHRLGGGFSVLGSFAGNRYRTRLFNSAATSTGFEAVARYQLSEVPIAFEYGIESEYLVSSVTATDKFGTSFSPVPLISREIHFVDLSFWKRWNPTCWTDGFAGYSVDRLGGAGPSAGINLRCEPRQGLGGTIWFDQRLHTVDTSQFVLRLGGTIFWRF